MLHDYKYNKVTMEFYFDGGVVLPNYNEACFTDIDMPEDVWDDYSDEEIKAGSIRAISYSPRWKDCLAPIEAVATYKKVLSQIFPEVLMLNYCDSVLLPNTCSGPYIMSIFRLLRAVEERPYQINTLHKLYEEGITDPHFVLLAAQNIHVEKDGKLQFITDHEGDGHHTLNHATFSKKYYKVFKRIQKRRNFFPPYSKIQRYKIGGQSELHQLFGKTYVHKNSFQGVAIEKFLVDITTFKDLVPRLKKLQQSWSK